jgi:hypothetical protein
MTRKGDYGDYKNCVPFIKISKGLKEYVENGDIDYEILEMLDLFTMITYIAGRSKVTGEIVHKKLDGWNINDNQIKEAMVEIANDMI